MRFLSQTKTDFDPVIESKMHNPTGAQVLVNKLHISGQRTPVEDRIKWTLIVMVSFIQSAKKKQQQWSHSTE